MGWFFTADVTWGDSSALCSYGEIFGCIRLDICLAYRSDTRRMGLADVTRNLAKSGRAYRLSIVGLLY